MIQAIDYKTGKIRWSHKWELGGSRSGLMSTAGNLVFHGSTAYKADTGEKLWETNLGGGNVTPISYMLDGKQYVTLFARIAGNRLFTFVLDGKEPIPAMPPPAAAPAKP